MNTYKVKVVEEIRYHITFEVEAESKEQAKNIIMENIVEGEIEDEDITYFDIISINEST